MNSGKKSDTGCSKAVNFPSLMAFPNKETVIDFAIEKELVREFSSYPLAYFSYQMLSFLMIKKAAVPRSLLSLFSFSVEFLELYSLEIAQV